ncbi:MAG: RsmB/NOP family class I SAM-dependent RNA methyltransferase [Candidatus Woesearchaeota archaeon]
MPQAALKAIPGADKILFKEKFIQRYSRLTNWELFKKYSLSFLRKSIRVNTIKSSVEELKQRLSKEWLLEPIPWCKEGFWIEHSGGRLDIGNTIEHSLGYIYVQEAASMIPPVVLNPKAGESVLDMCAAPGSKASQIAQLMENSGALVANDITGERLAALGMNLQRMGIVNAVITQIRGERFAKLSSALGLKKEKRLLEFDKVLVDAPCSGTGTIRKSLKTVQMWNPDMVKRLSGLQKALIASAFSILKSGGILVYSTCSLEPEENEEVVDWLIKKFPDAKLIPFELEIKRSPAVLEFDGKIYSQEVKKCLRIWPQDNDTEGFFVAKILKR